MALRSASPWRVAVRSRHLPFKTALSATRRHKSTSDGSDRMPTFFTIEMTKSLARNRDALTQTLKDLYNKNKNAIAGSHGHDAAVVLASPGLARLLSDGAFSKTWADLLSSPTPEGQFHLLGAVVDHVPSFSGIDGRYSEGISILRGPADTIFPQLWQPTHPKVTEDQDAVAALTFEVGGVSSITIPLARTIFLNGKSSTLIASRFDVSKNYPRLIESKEDHAQLINIPLARDSVKTPRFRLPMLAITPSRMVTESFGNILRGIEIDGKSAPASSELEDAVLKIQDQLQDMTSSFAGVWALVTTKSSSPKPQAPLPSDLIMEHTAEGTSQTSEYLEEAVRNGGRMFKLLSGGGGWGNKKGLLSLDPQTSHFAPSEEVGLQKLFGSGGESNFAPAGSEVQFFVSMPTTTDGVSKRSTGDRHLTFGVQAQEDRWQDVDNDASLTPNFFGAQSDHAIYVSGRYGSFLKLSAPASRLEFF